jgi:hypothetical protein
MSYFHDSQPVHHAKDRLEFRRVGDIVIVGNVPLNLSEWASAVAFTSVQGDNADTYERALALIESQPHCEMCAALMADA